MSVIVRYANSPEGRAALSWAVDECLLRQAELLVMTGDAPTLEHDLAAARASLGPRLSVQHVRDEDQLEAELLDKSYEEGTELIVIGLRRRSPVGKFLQGSSSQRLLLEAACVVASVKPPVGPIG